tara:strand:- start:49 stop:315 length:267 start_codon:yes stop_codon:yes gene_type:complete
MTEKMNGYKFIKPLTDDWESGHYKGTVEHYETLKKEFKFLKENKKRKLLNQWKKTHGLQYWDHYDGKWSNLKDSYILDEMDDNIKHNT